MKEHQLLIGLAIIALAIYFGLQNTPLTEFDACMKHSTHDDTQKYNYCALIVRGK